MNGGITARIIKAHSLKPGADAPRYLISIENTDTGERVEIACRNQFHANSVSNILAIQQVEILPEITTCEAYGDDD